MNISLGFLRTRVGRRYLFQFLAAAMVPTVLLAALAYSRVRDELAQQAATRVERMAKSVSLAALSALTRTEQAFRVLDPGRDWRVADDIFVTSIRADTGFGHPRSLDLRESARKFTEDELVHLRRGLSLLSAVTPGDEARLYIARAVFPSDLGSGVVWARINTAHLWETVDELVRGEQAQFCVFESLTRQRLRCASDMSPRAQEEAERLAFSRDQAGSSQPVARRVGGALVGARDLYLRFEFGVPDWRIVILEPEAAVFEPLQRFTRTFVLTIALALVLVFLLSYRSIRRSTLPLEQLQLATRRIAAGDLSTSLAVSSNDEFGELAMSFNGMAGALERQVSLLQSLDAIDEAVLAAPSGEASVDAALARLSGALRATAVTIARVVDADSGALEVHRLEVREAVRHRRSSVLPVAEREELLGAAREFVLRAGTDVRAYLPPPAAKRGGASPRPPLGEQVLVLPLVHEHVLVGAVALTYEGQVGSWSAERERARRLADRVALALANVHLVRRLEDLSTATLTAFARAIDANSAWTAGHSERVTQLALTVGRRLQLSARDLDTLRRGGLLHDIGKIGVPPSILDKPGKLTEEEWRVMKLHPTLGAQILRPLTAFADAIPIVLHHHERWDGTGYPDGLRAEAIPPLARVLAIADTFDALVSHRPYRRGMAVGETIEYLRRQSGEAFEPRVVTATLAAYAAGELHVETATATELDLVRALEQGRPRERAVAGVA